MRLLLKLLFAVILSAAPVPQTPLTIYNGIVSDTTGVPVPAGNVTFTLKPGVDTTISGNARFTPTAVSCVIANPSVVSTSGTTNITVVIATGQNWQAGDSIIFAQTADSGLNSSSVVSPFTITTVNSPTSYVFVATGTHTNGAGGTVGGLYSSSGTGPCQVVQSSAVNPAYTSYSVAIQPFGSTTSSFNTYAIGSGPIDISTIVPTPSQQPSYSFVDLFSNGQLISGQKSFTNTGNTYSGGTFNNPVLNNSTFNSTTATNWTLITPTIRAPVFTTQPITLGGANTYSISWFAAANRSLSINDPGGNDAFVFVNAAQSLTNKILGAGNAIGVPFVSVNNHATVGEVGVGTVVARVISPVQNSSIGSVIFYTPTNTLTQPILIIHYMLLTTSGIGGGGTVSLTINWEDAQILGIVKTSATISLAGTASEVDGEFVAYPLSANPISYFTTDSTPGTGFYVVRIWVEMQ